MKTGVVAVLLALVLIVAAGGGYLAGFSEGRTVTVQSTTSSSASTSTSVTCTDLGPTDGVELRVVANNGSWAGVSVVGETVGGSCDNQKVITTLGPASTNSTGWVAFLEYGWPGLYYVSVHADPSYIFNMTIPAVPTTTTIVTLNLSTGNVTTQFCEFNACRSAVTTTQTATTSVDCVISSEGSGFYVTVQSDAGQPIQGVQVSGSRVTQTNGGTCQQNIGTYLTNSTGSVLITPNIGSYYLLSMLYQGKNYTARAPIEPMTTTYVTLKVPSGNISISEVYEGGCQTSPEGVTCPG
jgi:hypothetical protein